MNHTLHSRIVGLVFVALASPPSLSWSSADNLRLHLDQISTMQLQGIDPDRSNRPCSILFGKLRRPPTGRSFRDVFAKVLPNAREQRLAAKTPIDLRLRYQGSAQEIPASSVTNEVAVFDLELGSSDHTLYLLEIQSKLSDAPDQTLGKVNEFTLYSYGQVSGAKAKVVRCLITR